MSHGTEIDADQARRGAGGAGEIDWERIERSPEFRELTSKRHRFIAVATTITLGLFAVYLALATFAVDFMGTTVLGGVPIAWLAAMCQVLMTWARHVPSTCARPNACSARWRSASASAPARASPATTTTAPPRRPPTRGTAPAVAATTERSAR